MVTKTDIQQAHARWSQAKERTVLTLGKLAIVKQAMRELSQNFQANTVTANAIAEFEKALEGAIQELHDAVNEQDRAERQYSLLRDKFDEQATESSQPS